MRPADDRHDEAVNLEHRAGDALYVIKRDAGDLLIARAQVVRRFTIEPRMQQGARTTKRFPRERPCKRGEK